MIRTPLLVSASAFLLLAPLASAQEASASTAAAAVCGIDQTLEEVVACLSAWAFSYECEPCPPGQYGDQCYRIVAGERIPDSNSCCTPPRCPYDVLDRVRLAAE